jgi:hypothetical protein
MDELNRIKNELFVKLNELTKLLEPLSGEIAGCCSKPLKEMSASEKIKLAILLINASKMGKS